MADRLDISKLYDGLPDRPAAELDRVLDAAERCLARFGLRRASMSDVAREMGVARSTLYRQVASIEEVSALVASRQVHRFLDDVVVLLAEGGLGVDTFVEATVAAVTHARTDPLVRRVLHDEPELIGELVASGQLARIARQVADLLEPLFAAAGAGGLVAGDAGLAAESMVRLVAGLVLVPPAGDLDETVRATLVPMLRAATASS